MVRNGVFWTIRKQYYIGYYPITFYQKIKFYKVETMDMRKFNWNNGVSGTDFISISTMVIILRDKILW